VDLALNLGDVDQLGGGAGDQGLLFGAVGQSGQRQGTMESTSTSVFLTKQILCPMCINKTSSFR
jgi:hypothetical protein